MKITLFFTLFTLCVLNHYVIAAVPLRCSHDSMGVDCTTYFDNTLRMNDLMANDITNAGIRWIRNNFRRKTTQNEIDYTSFDQIVQNASDRGINILGLIGTDSLQWSTNTDWQTEAWQISFSNRVMEIISRYHNDIHFWEIWNEPRTLSTVPADTYGEIISMCYHAIKYYYPDMTVLHAGLAWAWNDARDYLNDVYNSPACQAYYAAHGKYPFDIVAVHPYAWTSDPDTYLATQINGFKAPMNSHGDAHKRIWITELGWSNTDSSLGLNKGDQRANDYYQALYLTKAYTIIQNLTDPSYPEYGPYVQRMFWFAYEDNPYEDANLGLRSFSGFTVTTLGTNKPCYYAYKDLAAHAKDNFALHGTIDKDSRTIMYDAEYACDASPATYWMSKADTVDHYLIIDCGETKNILGHRLFHAEIAGLDSSLNTRAFTIETSDSASGPWTPQYTVNNSAGDPVHVLTNAAPVNARYVKLYISQPTGTTDDRARIAEWELYTRDIPLPSDLVINDQFNDRWINELVWERHAPNSYSVPQLYYLYETNKVLTMKAAGAWNGPAIETYETYSNVIITARVTIEDTTLLSGGNTEAHCGLAFRCNADGHEYHLNFFAHDGTTPDTPNIRLRRSGDWSTVGSCRQNITINDGDSFGIRVTAGFPASSNINVSVGHWPSYTDIIDWSGTDTWSENGTIQLENWQLAECNWDFITVEAYIPEPASGGILILLYSFLKRFQLW